MEPTERLVELIGLRAFLDKGSQANAKAQHDLGIVVSHAAKLAYFLPGIVPLEGAMPSDGALEFVILSLQYPIALVGPPPTNSDTRGNGTYIKVLIDS